MEQRPQLLSRPVKAFLKLAETLSYVEAAKGLGITQPALTLQIQKLERELGTDVRLFERGRSGVLLTPSGKEFLGHAIRARQELEFAADAIDAIRGLRRGTLRVGYSQGHLDLVSGVISELLREHPGVTISVTETMARRVHELILEGSLDVGLAYDWQPSDKIDAASAEPTPLTLIVPKEHRLAKRPVKDLVSLAGEPFILLQSGLAVRRTIDAYTARKRFAPRVVMETDDAAMIFSLVRNGNGITLFPVTPGTELRELVQVELPDAERQPTALLSRKGVDHPAAKAFIDAVMARLRGAKRARTKGRAKPG